MYIYLDESYNLQKSRGKMFISINGFAVLNEKNLSKRWKNIRKPYTKFGLRIHASNTRFDELKKESIILLGRYDVNILSVFQLIQEIPYKYFEETGINFDKTYADLLKKLLAELTLNEFKQVKIVIDSRKHKDGKLGEKSFRKNIENHLAKEFPHTTCLFKYSPSYLDILVELADFVSNTFYKEYQSGSNHVFQDLGFRLIQIKNPL